MPRRAAEKRDEFAPFQLIKLHPLPLAGGRDSIPDWRGSSQGFAALRDFDLAYVTLRVKTSPTSYRAYVSSRQVQQTWPPRERGTFTPLLPPDADRPARTPPSRNPWFCCTSSPWGGPPHPGTTCAPPAAHQRPSVGLPGPLCAVDFEPAVSAPTSAWATEVCAGRPRSSTVPPCNGRHCRADHHSLTCAPDAT